MLTFCTYWDALLSHYKNFCDAGSVSVKIEKTDGAIVARSLEAGQSFGELALLRAGGRRTATVVAAQTTELLTIDGVLYGRLLAKVQSQELADKVTVLSNCSCFR